jgi:hypothetical protein
MKTRSTEVDADTSCQVRWERLAMIRWNVRRRNGERATPPARPDASKTHRRCKVP